MDNKEQLCLSVCLRDKLYAEVRLVEELRYRRKVAGSYPEGVIRIFHWHNPSNYTMAQMCTQPLTEIGTRNISCEVKAAGA